MKKIGCYLLIAWLALMSGGANAHSTRDAAHETEHAVQVQTVSSDTPDSADSDHADACNQSHCGHGHSTGLLTPLGSCPKIDVVAALPVARSCWASAATANNIERPKWPFTTHTVVGLLT